MRVFLGPYRAIIARIGRQKRRPAERLFLIPPPFGEDRRGEVVCYLILYSSFSPKIDMVLGGWNNTARPELTSTSFDFLNL